MAANPFSWSKLAGFTILIVIMFAMLGEIGSYIYQPYGTTQTGNVLCQYAWNSTENANVIYNQQQYTIECLGQQLYGLNYSNNANSPEGKIFNLTQQTAFPKNASSSNSLGGLLAGTKLQNSIGLAFVFAGIGTLIQTISNFGAVFNLAMGGILGLLPNFLYLPVYAIIGVIVFYIWARMIMLGVSAWSKFDLIHT